MCCGRQTTSDPIKVTDNHSYLSNPTVTKLPATGWLRTPPEGDVHVSISGNINESYNDTLSMIRAEESYEEGNSIASNGRFSEPVARWVERSHSENCESFALRSGDRNDEDVHMASRFVGLLVCVISRASCKITSRKTIGVTYRRVAIERPVSRRENTAWLRLCTCGIAVDFIVFLNISKQLIEENSPPFVRIEKIWLIVEEHEVA